MVGRRPGLFVALLGILAIFLMSALSGPVPAAQASPTLVPDTSSNGYARECPPVQTPGRYTCYSVRRTGLHPAALGGPTLGYAPADLRAAYGLTTASATLGAGQTVYVIDAFGYPNAESDLAVYRANYHLPKCTTANGCFRKLNQFGAASPLPNYDQGWAGETALDLDMVSAICPLCHITLIEADDNGNNLFKAVDRANRLGAKYVSMSWGGPELAGGGDGAFDHYFSRTGVVYAASSGDGAYRQGVSYPASADNVVSVGGTTLVRTGSNWSETTWLDNSSQGTGSGCSADQVKPSWQQIIPNSVCANRAGNDVSAVADPDTGVAIYQTEDLPYPDWTVVGGTSASAPIIAAIYALAGPPAAAAHPAASLYAVRSALHDVTTGNNGSCSPALLCTAAVGWDGPTGLGTPRGINAFRPQSVTLTNPGNQLTVINKPVRLTVAAHDSFPGQQVALSASGLPAGLTMNTSGVVSGTVTTIGSSWVKVTATDGVATATTIFRWTVSNAGGFSSVPAARLLDTRTGTGAPRAPVAAGGSIAVQVLGRGGVPVSGVSAVVLNVTVNVPANAGYVTAYPDGITRPTTSNLNFVKGQTVPNLVLVPVGADGKVRLFTTAGADLIADVSGFYASGTVTQIGTFTPLSPARMLDSRTGLGAPAQQVPTGGIVHLKVLGAKGVPAEGVSAVVLNVTATGSSGNGYVTVYPGGPPGDTVPVPLASNLNFTRGTSVPNLVMVPVGSDGYVDLYVRAGGGTTDLVADVFGYYLGDGSRTASSAAGALQGVTPTRILDTRNGTGAPVTSGVGNGGTVTVTVPSPAGSQGFSAVALNVLVIAPTGAGYVTLYPTGSAHPGTSNLNYTRGQTVANLVVVPVGADGKVNLTVTGQGTTGLVADLAGYYLDGS